MPHRLSAQFACFSAVALLSFAQPLLSQRLWANSPAEAAAECARSLPSERVRRTELFLGLSKPDGSTVSDAEFLRFIDAEATPRLPGGFTVVAGDGRFKDPRDGAVVREQARVLVVLYPLRDAASSEGIEKIRAAYKVSFLQQSVLRVDGESCASF